MVNPNNSRDKKKEHFNVFTEIINDTKTLAIAIGIIVLLAVIVFLIVNHNKSQGGAGMMEFLSDTSPMAPLTNTPSM